MLLWAVWETVALSYQITRMVAHTALLAHASVGNVGEGNMLLLDYPDAVPYCPGKCGRKRYTLGLIILILAQYCPAGPRCSR